MGEGKVVKGKGARKGAKGKWKHRKEREGKKGK